ncbi:MAG: hypothetical protein R3B93_22865 [Bacteroidia bacterium]
MNRYLDEVVDFIKELKMELSQEAMALKRIIAHPYLDIRMSLFAIS